MTRKDFLKITALTGLSTGLFPQWTYRDLQETYTQDQLIGKYNPDIVGETYLTKMHRETASALKKLQASALQEGIRIEIVSAYRSFQRQKEIFESKYRDYTQSGMDAISAIEKIIEYSTIPGTSRHHWGTDLDLIDGNAPKPENVLVANHFHGNGPFCKMKEWMNLHAESFGFFEVYTDDAYRKGFKYEPWHFSYAPVSIPMLQAFKKLNLKSLLKNEKVLGNDYFTDTFIEKYRTENILDINPKLL